MPTMGRSLRILGIATLVAVGAVVVAYARLLARGDLLGGSARVAGPSFEQVRTGLARRGLTPAYVVTLETVGDRSGRTFSIPVVLAGFGGQRYVVSMLGERTPWVRNVRAAEGRAVIRREAARDVVLVEIPSDERAPILREYLRREAGARPHFPVEPDAPLEAFASIAADYPVFRVDEAD